MVLQDYRLSHLVAEGRASVDRVRIEDEAPSPGSSELVDVKILLYVLIVVSAGEVVFKVPVHKVVGAVGHFRWPSAEVLHVVEKDEQFQPAPRPIVMPICSNVVIRALQPLRQPENLVAVQDGILAEVSANGRIYRLVVQKGVQGWDMGARHYHCSIVENHRDVLLLPLRQGPICSFAQGIHVKTPIVDLHESIPRKVVEDRFGCVGHFW
mmetsp:Transcript_31106/g.50115  ORF Transcript_31106/g.50115 Transcript_31106/m.50115 type:complete len:210 (+) Transcript_31106:396-1025(+)